MSVFRVCAGREEQTELMSDMQADHQRCHQNLSILTPLIVMGLPCLYLCFLHQFSLVISRECIMHDKTYMYFIPLLTKHLAFIGAFVQTSAIIAIGKKHVKTVIPSPFDSTEHLTKGWKCFGHVGASGFAVCCHRMIKCSICTR